MPLPAGKAAAPQKQAQLHALGLPPLFHPGARAVCAGRPASWVAVGGGGGRPLLSTDIVTVPVPPPPPCGGGGGGVASVPFCWMAMRRKASKVLSAVGLMAKTMPLPQCGAGLRCLQYHHVGAVDSTVTMNKGAVAVSLASLGRKPESRPPASRTHGLTKELWVTVWFLASMTKCTISPTAAETWGGLKTRPEPPTTTCTARRLASWRSAVERGTNCVYLSRS